MRLESGNQLPSEQGNQLQTESRVAKILHNQSYLPHSEVLGVEIRQSHGL